MPALSSRGKIVTIDAPTVRLAHVPGAQGDNNLIGRNGVPQLPKESAPGLLVSYYYSDKFLSNQSEFMYRDWVLDSGAFSAYNSGKEINLDSYIECCKNLIRCDPTLKEIYALDVIGDWKKTIENTEKMWGEGVEAIPCYHLSDDNWDILKHLAKNYPKIAIGGVAELRGREKDRFIEQCFARIWPKKVHGFGCGKRETILKYPFHSTDATTWQYRVCKFGEWYSFGGVVSVRGSSQNLRPEIEYYLQIEREARDRWKKEMRLLEELFPTKTLHNPDL